jgi:hypothetical protein
VHERLSIAIDAARKRDLRLPASDAASAAHGKTLETTNRANSQPHPPNDHQRPTQ